MDQTMLTDNDRFNLKLALEMKDNIIEGGIKDIQLKNSLLRFYLTFNIFESIYYEKPQWLEDEDVNSTYKKNWERRNEIQKFCNQTNRIHGKEVDSKSAENLRKSILELSTHFRERYINSSNDWNEIGKGIEKSKNNPSGLCAMHCEWIKSFLTEKQSSYSWKRHSVSNSLIISYYFRNNLFHGTKEISCLAEYIDEFICIENFMTSLMKFLEKNNSPKY